MNFITATYLEGAEDCASSVLLLKGILGRKKKNVLFLVTARTEACESGAAGFFTLRCQDWYYERGLSLLAEAPEAWLEKAGADLQKLFQSLLAQLRADLSFSGLLAMEGQALFFAARAGEILGINRCFGRPHSFFLKKEEASYGDGESLYFWPGQIKTGAGFVFATKEDPLEIRKKDLGHVLAAEDISSDSVAKKRLKEVFFQSGQAFAYVLFWEGVCLQ